MSAALRSVFSRIDSANDGAASAMATPSAAVAPSKLFVRMSNFPFRIQTPVWRPATRGRVTKESEIATGWRSAERAVAVLELASGAARAGGVTLHLAPGLRVVRIDRSVRVERRRHLVFACQRIDVRSPEHAH